MFIAPESVPVRGPARSWHVVQLGLSVMSTPSVAIEKQMTAPTTVVMAGAARSAAAPRGKPAIAGSIRERLQ